MGILDEAIREHLELKRQHGAGDSELKQLEDDAFGQAERPGDEEQVHDPLAEAPTEFMTQPETESAPEPERREPTITDLQEAPAMEHEVVADPPEPAADEEQPEVEAAGPSTEERQVIAEQPTEMFDIEQELGEAPAPTPTDEQLLEEEIAEPRLAPTDPLAGIEEIEEAEVSIQRPAPDDDDEYEDEDDAFWNEQRLSDELDQALEAPRDPEPEVADEPEPQIVAEPEPEPEAESEPEEPESEDDLTPVEPEARRDEDVLEETPDFLEEAPEDDQLWFEQKPPKDFDFDD
jgi:hypothetical protein